LLLVLLLHEKIIFIRLKSLITTDGDGVRLRSSELSLATNLKTIISSSREIMNGSSLRCRSTKGGIALGVGTVANRGSRFVRNMFLVRLLTKEEFGLMAIVVAASALFETLTEVGVKQSIIQNKSGSKEEYINVAWWFQFIRSVGLFLIAYFLSPFICEFYNQPEMLTLLRVGFLSILCNGLISPRAYVLEKEFKFNKSVVLIHGSALVATVVTVVLAFLIRSVWALVIGFTLEAFLRCSLSYLMCPFCPKFKIDRDSFFTLSRFASRMLGLPLIVFITFQMDIFVIGKVVSMEALGLYSMALALSRVPSNVFTGVIGPVLLPAFSERQDDKKFMLKGVLFLSKWSAIFGIPLAVFMAVASSEILSVIYGSSYSVVAGVFVIMCFCALVTIQSLPLVSVYFALGKPHLHRAFVALRAVLIIVFIYPAAKRYGLAGVVSVVFLSNLIALFMQIRWMGKPIGLDFRKYVSSWSGGFQLGVIMAVSTWAIKLVSNGNDFFVLFAGAGACLMVWLYGFLNFRPEPKEPVGGLSAETIAMTNILETNHD